MANLVTGLHGATRSHRLIELQGQNDELAARELNCDLSVCGTFVHIAPDKADNELQRINRRAKTIARRSKKP